jgi:hypothetical protein
MQACWNELYSSSYPEQYQSSGVTGTRYYRIYWFNVCKTSGMYGRLSYGDCQ